MSERDHGATDGLHLGDAGGEEKRCDEGNSPSWRGLYRFEKSSWLTPSPSTELKYDVLAREEIDVEAGLAAVVD